jgi:peroxiredoxin
MATSSKTISWSVAIALPSVLVLGCAHDLDKTLSDPVAADFDSTESVPYAELDITLPDLEDDDVTIASDSADTVHILAFWAVWCVPCTAELAKMKGMYDRLEPRGLEIYAVSIDGPDTMSRVPGFASQEGWRFPVLYDSDTEILARYNPKGDIPFYAVLDAKGNIIKTHQGYVKGDIIELEQFLDQRLPAAAE